MAELFFCVFEGAAETASGDPIQEAKFTIDSVSPSTIQSVAIIGSGKKRKRVRVFADGDCFVTWGSNPAAKNDGSDGRPVGAGVAEYFDIESEHKLSATDR